MTLEIPIYDIHGDPLWEGCPVRVSHAGQDMGRGWIIYDKTFHAVMVEMEDGYKTHYALVKRGVERLKGGSFGERG